MGTIAALAPIAVGISGQTDISIALAMATLLAERCLVIIYHLFQIQQSQPLFVLKNRNEKIIVLPAAIITIVLLVIVTSGSDTQIKAHSFDWIKILPYAGVLITALLGWNVLLY